MTSQISTASPAVNIVRAGPGGGTPVILLHAVSLDLTCWDAPFARLSATRDVVAFDWPGHGRSSPLTGAISFDRLAGAIEAERGVSQAQIALAWLHRHPVVAAPIVGALKTGHIDDALAALAITLSDDEAARLEAPYTPRRDFQGVSDPAMLTRAAEAVTGFKTAAA